MSNIKQEELELKFDKILYYHLIDNDFSSQYLAMNINTIQKLRTLFNQEVTSVLEELEKKAIALKYESMLINNDSIIGAVPILHIQSIKDKYS